MAKAGVNPLAGELMDEQVELSLVELCRASQSSAEQILEFVEFGVIEPRGRQPSEWRFTAISVKRVYSAQRLQHDLGLNAAGVALALDLIEEIETLRARLGVLER